MRAGGKCKDVGFDECGGREETMRRVFARSDWLTVEQVSALLGVPVEIGARRVSGWRQESRIFCVTLGGRDYFARYEFDGFGEPLPVVKEVLDALGRLGDGWKIAAWFDFGNGWIAGSGGQAVAPKDALDRRDEVVNAARRMGGGYIC
jgi:hypothetical protein